MSESSKLKNRTPKPSAL